MTGTNQAYEASNHHPAVWMFDGIVEASTAPQRAEPDFLNEKFDHHEDS